MALRTSCTEAMTVFAAVARRPRADCSSTEGHSSLSTALVYWLCACSVNMSKNRIYKYLVLLAFGGGFSYTTHCRSRSQSRAAIVHPLNAEVQQRFIEVIHQASFLWICADWECETVTSWSRMLCASQVAKRATKSVNVAVFVFCPFISNFTHTESDTYSVMYSNAYDVNGSLRLQCFK